jgi:5-formyltetrahydrofolate cyclo-ligase
MTKDAIRQQVWSRIEAADAARFPGTHNRIPNFAHAEHAARLLSDLTIWKRAKVIKFGASAPLLAARRVALRQDKLVYLARPGLLAERCFLELDPSKLGVRTATAANVRGALQVGRAVTPQEMRSVDLVVVGSVAVTKQGARLGKGGGTEDLEYGLLREAGKAREYTPIITLVHPLQIVSDRIPMRAHDIPVDFLITPDQVIAAPSLYQRPRGIMWDLLPENRIRSIPSLRNGRPRQTRTPTPRHL